MRECFQIGCGIALVGATVGVAYAQSAADYQSMIDRFCVDCHNEAEAAGGMQLETRSVEELSEDAELWEKVIVKLRGNAMPPPGEARPDVDMTHGFAAYLADELDELAEDNPNPGRPALYRLNRAEYAAAIRDLLALDVDVTELLPPDNSSYGFDNIADVLTVSPALLEGYLAAADRISAVAIGDPDIPAEEITYRARSSLSQDKYIDGMPLGTRGGLLIEHNFPLDGIYEFNTTFVGNSVDGIRGMQFPHQFEISIDGKQEKLVTIGGQADYMQMMENTAANNETIANRTRLRVRLSAGVHRIAVTFLEKTGALEVDQFQPFEFFNFDPVYLGGVPSVASVLVRGPFNGRAPSGSTASRDAIFSCRPSGTDDELLCADEILSRLARRAYRRPLNERDNETLREFFEAGRNEKGTFDAGIQMGIRRILASPEFMFRIERDPDGVEPGEAYRLTDLELASRLSFFLWSSIPDDELIDLAARGELSDPDTLEDQVTRMLADAKATALVDNFAAQWLHLRNLDSVEPDSIAFPNFDDNLRRAFKEETSLFVESIIREDRSVLEFLTADYTFLNQRLARHYGVKGVYGDGFRRVQLNDSYRHGLLGHGSVLTVTSLSHRTSPVVRGKWVLENVLGTPPPIPPDNVPALDENDPESLDRESLRVRLERHRNDPNCSSCHSIMDPIGLALENFDGIGTWRQVDESGIPIDASGQLADGTPIDGVDSLRDALIADPAQFAGTLTEKLLTYAIGRGVEYYDMPTVRQIVANGGRNDYRFSSIVLEIVNSMPFQMKQAAGPDEQVSVALQQER